MAKSKIKQVIIVNKALNMSHGKMAAMVAHGTEAFFKNWLNEYATCFDSTFQHFTGWMDINIYNNWVKHDTIIVLEADDDTMMEKIIQKAHNINMINGKDFFNIVDESTEFNDIPRWACIAFAPMKEERIDHITGNLNLYGYSENEVSNNENI